MSWLFVMFLALPQQCFLKSHPHLFSSTHVLLRLLFFSSCLFSSSLSEFAMPNGL